mgnify:CR=1 FL=1
MHTPTLTEMKRESEYLRGHPEEMAKEFYWLGKRMPVAEMTPTDALEVLVPQAAKQAVATTRAAHNTRKLRGPH